MLGAVLEWQLMGGKSEFWEDKMMGGYQTRVFAVMKGTEGLSDQSRRLEAEMGE